jgi:hypothetical protein
LKRSRSAIWSWKASSTAHPVELYDEPAIAYPWSSSQDEMRNEGESAAGLALPGAT